MLLQLRSALALIGLLMLVLGLLYPAAMGAVATALVSGDTTRIADGGQNSAR